MLFRLIEPTIEMEKEYIDYIDEWERLGENIVPYASRRSINSYSELLSFGEIWLQVKHMREALYHLHCTF